jgi:hypothetical protein
MEKYIKYQRFIKTFFTDEEIQNFLDMLITDGWEIIFYKEEEKTKRITIIVIGGKRQSNVL